MLSIKTNVHEIFKIKTKCDTFMTTLYDVPTNILIAKLAESLKEIDVIKPPSWAFYAKTSVFKERAPEVSANIWWYNRAASLLRKIYINNPIGINRLRRKYSGNYKKSTRPYHFKKGGGAITRTLLHQLEEAGLTQINQNKGRSLTSKGISLLDRLAHQIKIELQKEIVDLKKY